MPITRIAPLIPPKLYPDDPQVILIGMYAEAFSASNGTLNDFSPHAPIPTLYEGHVWGILEELYSVNRLPNAIGLSFLARAGIVQILGTAAVVSLTFTLSAALSTPFTLSAGYICKDSAGHEFATDTVLTIPAGQTQGTVSATASALIDGLRQAAIGTAYNVPAYSVSRLTDGRAFLKSVTNTEPATGGTNAETLDETAVRAFALLRRRDTLISADDYEQAAIAYLGAGSVAIAIGRLSSDRTTEQDGAVAVFVLNPDRTAPNTTALFGLQSALASQSAAGLQDLVSTHAIELLLLEIHVIAELVPGSDPEMIARLIYSTLERSLSPDQAGIGETLRIKKVEAAIDDTGVAAVGSVVFYVVDGVSANATLYNGDVQMPMRWAMPIVYGANITLIDLSTSEQRFEYSYGVVGDLD